MSKELTGAQTRVLDFVRLFMTANGYSPTRAEIGKSLGFNPNAAQEHLQAIQRKGHIRLVQGTARGIQLAAMPTEQISMMDVLADTIQPIRRSTLRLGKV